MTKVRFLVTTTIAGRRYAKGDVFDISEDSAMHLVALRKAEATPEKQGKDEPVDVPAKAKRKE